MGRLNVDVVSAEGSVFHGEAELVVAPGTVGELTILPSHAPLITGLRPGELRLQEKGEETLLVVTGGFMEVHSNRVTILADAAEEAGEIDIERAEAAMKAAQERIASRSADANIEQALASLGRAQVRLRVARRARERRGGSRSAPAGG